MQLAGCLRTSAAVTVHADGLVWSLTTTNHALEGPGIAPEL